MMMMTTMMMMMIVRLRFFQFENHRYGRGETSTWRQYVGHSQTDTWTQPSSFACCHNADDSFGHLSKLARMTKMAATADESRSSSVPSLPAVYPAARKRKNNLPTRCESQEDEGDWTEDSSDELDSVSDQNNGQRFDGGQQCLRKTCVANCLEDEDGKDNFKDHSGSSRDNTSSILKTVIAREALHP